MWMGGNGVALGSLIFLGLEEGSVLCRSFRKTGFLNFSPLSLGDQIGSSRERGVLASGACLAPGSQLCPLSPGVT